MLKRKVFTVPIYGSKIKVEQDESLDGLFKKHKIDGDGEAYWAITTRRKGRILMLFSSRPTPGIIAHEAVHAVNLVFGHIGYRLCTENDEAQAYLTQYIVSKLHKILKC
jgi:hypothetical protein